MPVYCYRCAVCNATAERETTMHLRPSSVPCECGARMGRDYRAEGKQALLFYGYS